MVDELKVGVAYARGVEAVEDECAVLEQKTHGAHREGRWATKPAPGKTLSTSPGLLYWLRLPGFRMWDVKNESATLLACLVEIRTPCLEFV